MNIILTCVKQNLILFYTKKYIKIYIVLKSDDFLTENLDVMSNFKSFLSSTYKKKSSQNAEYNVSFKFLF